MDLVIIISDFQILRIFVLKDVKVFLFITGDIFNTFFMYILEDDLGVCKPGFLGLDYLDFGFPYSPKDSSDFGKYLLSQNCFYLFI